MLTFFRNQWGEDHHPWLATGQQQFSSSLCKLVEKYAEILASQGLLSTAMGYLILLGTEELSPELTVLRECIVLSMEIEKEQPKSMPSENPQTGFQYGADQPSFSVADSSPQYYQEPAPSHLQGVTGRCYGNNYQQSFGGPNNSGYGVPVPYQPAMWVPQDPQIAPKPVNIQPPGKYFTPANPVTLRNAEQCQHPPLGSQLYPRTGNPNYPAVPCVNESLGPTTSQLNPIAGPKAHQVFAPAPVSGGFMPITKAGIQRSIMGQTQPSSPTQSTQVQPTVTSAVPPPTIETADTSNVPAHQRPVTATLTRLFNESSEAMGRSRAIPV